MSKTKMIFLFVMVGVLLATDEDAFLFKKGHFKISAASQQDCTLNLTIRHIHRQLVLHNSTPAYALFEIRRKFQDSSNPRSARLKVELIGSEYVENKLVIIASPFPLIYEVELGNVSVSITAKFVCAPGTNCDFKEAKLPIPTTTPPPTTENWLDYYLRMKQEENQTTPIPTETNEVQTDFQIMDIFEEYEDIINFVASVLLLVVTAAIYYGLKALFLYARENGYIVLRTRAQRLREERSVLYAGR